MVRLPFNPFRLENKGLHSSPSCFHYSTKSLDFLPKLRNMLIPKVKIKHMDQLTTTDLLVKSGFLFQSSSGFYGLLPLAKKALDNIEEVVKQELETIGCQQVDLPLVVTKTLLKKSGRWDTLGTELFRMEDRKNTWLALAPTHEEEIVQLVRSIVFSYKQLPVKVYQIGKKFRDELRPRMGLLRSKEFLMKDLYTFDLDQHQSLLRYQEVADCYARIFHRLGLKVKKVQADSGKIGGSVSHEYHLITEAGEDTLICCSKCDYSTNLELATSTLPNTPFHSDDLSYFKVTNSTSQLPSLVIVHRLDRINLCKLEKLVQVQSQPSQLTLHQVQQMTFAQAVVDLRFKPVQVEVQSQVPNLGLTFLDLRTVLSNEACPQCTQPLTQHQAIELGHTFHLNTRYSLPLNGTFTTSTNTLQPFVMGCYGLGLSRILQASLHLHRDCKGFQFPSQLAPYQILVLILGELSLQTQQTLVETVGQVGNRWILDDEVHLPIPYRFKRADLLGFPVQLRIGGNLPLNQVEVSLRNQHSTQILHFHQLELWFQSNL